MMLTTQATRTKSRGDLLSPRPRKTAASRLYATMKKMPERRCGRSCSQGHSFGGGLHQHRDAARKTDHHNEEHGGEKGKHDGRTADDRADELRLFLTQIPGNEDRDAHGQLGDDEGDEVEHLAAGGDRRQADGGAEPAHDQQVYRAIGRLQHQCAQDGEHEGSQLFQDAALRKIVFLRSQGKFSFRKTLGGMLQWCG